VNKIENTEAVSRLALIKWYALVLAVWAVYLGLSLNSPLIGAYSLPLSMLEVIGLKIAIAVIMLTTWLVAVRSAVKLACYVRGIHASPDGPGFVWLSRGLNVLVFGLISNALLGQLRPYALSGGWIEYNVIAQNHLNVIFPLVAFYYIFKGSRRLINLIGAENVVSKQVTWLYPVFAFLAWFYTYIVYRDPNRRIVTAGGAQYASHYLPDTVLLFTLITPLLVAWALGVMAVVNLNAYRLRVSGQIYRQSIKRLAQGLMVVIILSLLAQLIQATSSAVVASGLTVILAVIYLLLLLFVAGYGLIASGVRRLTRIEDVK
jgi:hypothetical protein